MAVDQIHDPSRQTRLLRQAASTDKLALGFLLGAGCPQAITVKDGDDSKPIIPAIAGLTEAVLGKLKSNDDMKSLIQHVEGHFTEDAKESANIPLG